MSQFEKLEPSPVTAKPLDLAGTRARNLYFLIKLALLWGGYLNLQVLPNLVFAAVLLIPLRQRHLAALRTLIAVPVGVALFYQDTWLPPFSRLLDQPGVLNFTPEYLLDAGWPLHRPEPVRRTDVDRGRVFFVRQWLRLTTFTLAAFAWLGVAACRPGMCLCIAGTVGHARAGHHGRRTGQQDAGSLPAKIL